MIEIFQEVMKLQSDWSSANTPAMSDRGVLIRDDLPESIQPHLPQLSRSVGKLIDDLAVEGSDGTGRKTPIPWVRFFSRSRSPSPQNGWYCVFLFHPDANGFYLALSHGSTSFINGSFVRRDPKQIQTLMEWALKLVDPSDFDVDHVSTEMDLGNSSTKLDRAYEASTVFAKWYDADNLPSEDALISDASAFAAMLGVLYEAQDSGRTPGQDAPEVVEAESAVERAAKPLAFRKGQGIGLTGPERKAVEMRAMMAVRAVLESEGYSVKETSLKASYDFEARKDGITTFVEVKGTTGGLGSVLLTSNEVELHKSEHPNNALFVLHSIDLDKTLDPPQASGGTMFREQPWQIEEKQLQAIAYKYTL